jgi:hypothetical protein
MQVATASRSEGAVIRLQVPGLHPGQASIYRERKRFNVLECGRRFGKTVLGERLAGDRALEKAQPVGWFAPTYKILDDATEQLVEMYRPAITDWRKQARRIEFMGGGSIEFWSLQDENAGRSRKYGRVILDEAGLSKNLREAWEGAIRPTLTDLEGDGWFLGTPKGHNYFHRLYLRGETEPEWASWRRGQSDNPHIPAAEMEAARRELPREVFEQEYLGIPAPDGGNPFGLDAIRDAESPTSSGSPVCWGWDLAKSHDWTWGIALDSEMRICRSIRFQKPWQETEEIILRETGAQALVDSTGVGDPVLESLQSRSKRVFEGFKFSSSSKQQIMEGLRLVLQRRELSGISHDLAAELEAFQYEYTPSGVRYAAAPGMHDDGVCSLALAVHKFRNRGPDRPRLSKA